MTSPDPFDDEDSTMSIEQGRRETPHPAVGLLSPSDDMSLDFANDEPGSPSMCLPPSERIDISIEQSTKLAEPSNLTLKKVEGDTLVPSNLTPAVYREHKIDALARTHSDKPAQPASSLSPSETLVPKRRKRRNTDIFEQRHSSTSGEPPHKRPAIRAAAVEGTRATSPLIVDDVKAHTDGDDDTTIKPCSSADLSTFAPAARLNDAALKACLDILALTAPDIVVVESLLVQPPKSLPDADPPHTQIRNAKLVFEVAQATKGGKQGLLLVPVHLRASEHWVLVVVVLSAAGTARVDLYDSLPPTTTAAAEQDRLRAVQHCLSGILPRLLPSVKLQPLRSRLCPRQTNGHDCGLFAIVNTAFLVAGLPLPSRHDGAFWRRVLLSLLDPALPPAHPNACRLPLVDRAITHWDDQPLVTAASLPPPTALPARALLSVRECAAYQAAEAARLETLTAGMRVQYVKALAGRSGAAARARGDLQDAVEIFGTLLANAKQAGEGVARAIDAKVVEERSLAGIVAEQAQNTSRNIHGDDAPVAAAMAAHGDGEKGRREHEGGTDGRWPKQLAAVQRELGELRRVRERRHRAVDLLERLLAEQLVKALEDVEGALERMAACGAV